MFKPSGRVGGGVPPVPDTGSLTEGDIRRPLFALAWPIIVTELLQVAYNLTDTLWLGRLSTHAVAAVSLAFPLIFLLISVGGGFTVAGSTLVAQYVGANSEGSAGAVTGQTLTFITAIAVAVGALGFVSTDAMLSVLPSSPATAGQVVPHAAGYMRVFFLGLPFLFGFFVFSALMRGYGNTRAPMVVMFVSVAVNVVIDPLLIFGYGPVPGYGVEGAAIATVLSRGIATVLGLYVIFGTAVGPAVTPRDFRPQLRYVRQIVSIGVPSALEQSATALGFITLTAIVVQFTPEVVAAYGLGNRLTSLVFLPAMGLGRATNTMVGQNLGARKPDRAERAVWLAARTGAGVMVLIGAVTFLFADAAVGVFLGTGTASAARTVELGAAYLRIRAVEFGFIGVLQVVLGAYRGAGNTKTALAFSLFALWVGRIPIVYYLAFVRGWAETGVWVGMAAGQMLGAVAAAAWFTRGTWKRTVVAGGAGGVGADGAAGGDADGADR